MNILIKTSDESSQQSNRSEHKLQSLLHKLCIKVFRSAENVLQQNILNILQNKYEEYVEKKLNATKFLQFFIYSMLNQIDQMQQISSMDIVREDYKMLQNTVQKSQAEIRKHIRVEQQLKIYLDNLQEKIEQLQKELSVQQFKYSQLFETMRQIEEQKKGLLKRINKVEQSKQKNKTNSNYSTINDHIYKDYYAANRKSKANTKSRHVIQKYNERGRKLSDKKSRDDLHIIEGSIQINLSNNIVVNKKGSYDQSVNKNHPISHDNSIKELTKTVQMKQTANPCIRRPNRKILKYKTEMSEGIQKKEGRSNSVCN